MTNEERDAFILEIRTDVKTLVALVPRIASLEGSRKWFVGFLTAAALVLLTCWLSG